MADKDWVWWWCDKYAWVPCKHKDPKVVANIYGDEEYKIKHATDKGMPAEVLTKVHAGAVSSSCCMAL